MWGARLAESEVSTMRLENLALTQDSQAVPCWSSSTPDADYDLESCGLQEERRWRHPAGLDGASQANILSSRWLDSRSFFRREEAESSADRHVVSIALKSTRLKLTRGARTVYDGIMPVGMLQVTGPSQRLTAEFQSPCDFIHFYVRNDYLRERRDAALSSSAQPMRDLSDLSDLTIRDPLAEQLGRTLIEGRNAGDRLYAESVGQTLVMRLAGLQPSRTKVSALSKWRLKRVQEYVDAHIDEALHLPDLAAAAGLSRMHFAAQFRAATGYRPHEYLLHQRIERAKEMLSSLEMPLVEVALNVGFRAQAHFSTVFKRLTGQTPGRWRRSVVWGRAD
jgi:AraC family transcriptional regulator